MQEETRVKKRPWPPVSPHENRRPTGIGDPHPPRVQIKFVPADLWFGVYIGPEENASGWSTGYVYRKVYVCLIPCFPIIFTKRLALH